MSEQGSSCINLASLINIVSDMPTSRIHLCKFPSDMPISKSNPLELPISDHDIIIGINKHGVIATWNMLNPDSPVSPGLVSSSDAGLYGIGFEAEKQEHLKLVAQMIILLFKHGVDGVTLQEVPAVESRYRSFITILKTLAEKEKLNLNFEAFKDSFMQTKKSMKKKTSGQEFHPFGTAFLFQSETFCLEKNKVSLEGRGSSYVLRSNKSNEAFNLINIHGDYSQSDALMHYIKKELNNPQVMILGDTNIALNKTEIVKQFKDVKGVVIEPSTNRPNTPKQARTLDCFLTTIQTDYIFNINCFNYATL